MFEEFDDDGSGHIEKDEMNDFLAHLISTNRFSKKKKSKSKKKKKWKAIQKVRWDNYF